MFAGIAACWAGLQPWSNHMSRVHVVHCPRHPALPATCCCRCGKGLLRELVGCVIAETPLAQMLLEGQFCVGFYCSPRIHASPSLNRVHVGPSGPLSAIAGQCTKQPHGQPLPSVTQSALALGLHDCAEHGQLSPGSTHCWIRPHDSVSSALGFTSTCGALVLSSPTHGN